MTAAFLFLSTIAIIAIPHGSSCSAARGAAASIGTRIVSCSVLAGKGRPAETRVEPWFSNALRELLYPAQDFASVTLVPSGKPGTRNHVSVIQASYPSEDGAMDRGTNATIDLGTRRYVSAEATVDLVMRPDLVTLDLRGEHFRLPAPGDDAITNVLERWSLAHVETPMHSFKRNPETAVVYDCASAQNAAFAYAVAEAKARAIIAAREAHATLGPLLAVNDAGSARDSSCGTEDEKGVPPHPNGAYATFRRTVIAAWSMQGGRAGATPVPLRRRQTQASPAPANSLRAAIGGDTLRVEEGTTYDAPRPGNDIIYTDGWMYKFFPAHYGGARVTRGVVSNSVFTILEFPAAAYKDVVSMMGGLGLMFAGPPQTRNVDVAVQPDCRPQMYAQIARAARDLLASVGGANLTSLSVGPVQLNMRYGACGFVPIGGLAQGAEWGYITGFRAPQPYAHMEPIVTAGIADPLALLRLEIQPQNAPGSAALQLRVENPASMPVILSPPELVFLKFSRDGRPAGGDSVKLTSFAPSLTSSINGLTIPGKSTAVLTTAPVQIPCGVSVRADLQFFDARYLSGVVNSKFDLLSNEAGPVVPCPTPSASPAPHAPQ